MVNLWWIRGETVVVGVVGLARVRAVFDPVGG
jgi:hypothetical protein